MSRCFPFPPPGYEKKARTDDLDLLKKEKKKEKKHKKDKKDKDKRENKEKREKEGRDGKHKEKKDKKEKHREKKKDKDRDKGKDKNKDRDKSKIGTADSIGFPGQAEGHNAGKLHQKEVNQDNKEAILFENKLAKQHTSNNGQKARENNHLAEKNKDSKFLLELDRRIRDVDGGANNQLFQKFTKTDQRKDEGTVKLVAKGSGIWPDSNEKLMGRSLDAKKIDGEVLPIGNAPVQNHSGNFHPGVDGMPKFQGKYFDRSLEATVEGKEKVKEKKKDEGKEKAWEKTEEGKEKVREKKDERKEKVKEKKDDKRAEKRKDKDKEKKGHGKDKDRDKEKKKQEKAKEPNDLKTIEQMKLKEGNKIGLLDSNSFSLVSKNNHESENPKKRKDIELNGISRADDNRPSKFPRSSSLAFTENGRTLEPCQIPNASDRSVVANSVKVENKECKRNGFIEAHPFAVSSNNTHTASMPTDPVVGAYTKSPHPIVEASTYRPHPDVKYLSQLYSVPKVDQWSDFDDQEWLFDSSVSQERKPVVQSSEVGETKHVWAEAMLIEPADVFALPYVVPY